jgi:hypothetical protein
MFNIIISGDGTAWETDQLMRILAERFKEGSGSEADRISLSDPASLLELETVPTLLIYEKGAMGGPNEDLVRYGFLKEIKKSGQDVVFGRNKRRNRQKRHQVHPGRERFPQGRIGACAPAVLPNCGSISWPTGR